MIRRSTEPSAAGLAATRVAPLLLGALSVALLSASAWTGWAQPREAEHFAGPDEPCLECHDDLLSAGTTLHSPAEEEFCDACHAVEGESDLFTVTTPSGDQTCLECHDGALKEAPEGGSLHGLLQRDACVVCHDPHASAHASLLRASINDLCMTCHVSLTDEERAASPLRVDAATYEQAGKIFLGDDRAMGHPMLAHPVVGEELNCLSCHASHAAPHPGLMLGGLEICARCHA